MTLEADLAAASDPSTPPAKLIRLARSKDIGVRRAVARNMASPKVALDKLFTEFSEEVVSNPASALFNMEPEGAWAWINRKAQESVAVSEKTAVSVLESLALNACLQARAGVARNKKTPPSVLQTLASDADWSVRYWVARNEDAPVHALERLAKDVDWDVRFGVAGNAKTPTYILESLCSDQNLDVSNKARFRRELMQERGRRGT